MTTTDLIIIGAGPGGYKAAGYAAGKGLSVIIFEADEAGGTCLNRGCIPTKAYCHVADTILDLKSTEELEVHLKLDFKKMHDHKDDIVAQLRQQVEMLMQQPGITLVKGKATFKDSKTVTCNGEAYQASNIIIATGSSPKMPPIEGIADPCVVDSTALLAMDSLPKRLIIVGAGVIGMELASAFSTFGSEVTVIEFLKECLPPVDSEVAKRLRRQMEKQGVKFFLQSGVKSIHSGTVSFDQKGKEKTVEGDIVLVATGRQANTDGLNLETAGVEYSRKGITVDDNLLTSRPHIYAIGDVNGRQMLAHAAEFQAKRAVDHLLGLADNIRLSIMPSAVFTHPEVAGVGLTEDECKVQGLNYECRKALYRANGKAMSMNATEGLLKLIVSKDDERLPIIGCHAMGAHAADLIQEATVWMNSDIPFATRLRDIVHIHPTLSEILLGAAE